MDDLNGISPLDRLKSLTTEETKKYIESQYTGNQVSHPQRIQGRRLFTTRLKAVQDFQANETVTDEEVQTPQFETEPIQQVESIIQIPVLSHLNIHEPTLIPPENQRNNGVSELEETTTSLTRNIEDIEAASRSISDIMHKFESCALECQQLAELSGLMSESSQQQLLQIQEHNGSFTFKRIFSSLWHFLNQ